MIPDVLFRAVTLIETYEDLFQKLDGRPRVREELRRVKEELKREARKMNRNVAVEPERN